MNYSRRIARALFGLLLFGTGSCCNIQANVGLAPWEAFSMGVGARLGLSFGTVLAGSGLVILAVDLLLREKIGLGTLLDIACIGPIADLLRAAGAIPVMTGFPSGIATLLAGQLLIAVGSYFYIGAGLSCGPRDALMVALCKRFPHTPVGVIRFFIEGGALLTGSQSDCQAACDAAPRSASVPSSPSSASASSCRPYFRCCVSTSARSNTKICSPPPGTFGAGERFPDAPQNEMLSRTSPRFFRGLRSREHLVFKATLFSLEAVSKVDMLNTVRDKAAWPRRAR